MYIISVRSRDLRLAKYKMLNWKYSDDVKLMNSKKTIEWTDKCPREQYVKFYQDYSCEPNIYRDHIAPIDHVEIELDENDEPLPKFDALLVRRCHMRHNLNLCKKREYTDDYILDWNDNIYEGDGHLFSTYCCAGWYYGNSRCACGMKKYLDLNNAEFDNIKYFNLNSTEPIGFPQNR